MVVGKHLLCLPHVLSHHRIWLSNVVQIASSGSTITFMHFECIVNLEVPFTTIVVNGSITSFFVI